MSKNINTSTPISTPTKTVHHFTLDKPWARFDKSLQDAAGRGKITNAEPLVRQLNSAMRAFSGLSVLLTIVANNSVLEDGFDTDDAKSIRPLTEASICALLGLASEICSQQSDDICRVADWTDEHIEKQGGNS